jgi:hypothetical protein
MTGGGARGDRLGGEIIGSGIWVGFEVGRDFAGDLGGDDVGELLVDRVAFQLEGEILLVDDVFRVLAASGAGGEGGGGIAYRGEGPVRGSGEAVAGDGAVLLHADAVGADIVVYGEIVEFRGRRAGGVELGFERQTEHLAGALGDVSDCDCVEFCRDRAVAALAVKWREAAAREGEEGQNGKKGKSCFKSRCGESYGCDFRAPERSVLKYVSTGAQKIPPRRTPERLLKQLFRV